MKRLALLVIIITLPIIAYYQYQKYRRFHPPTSYDYAANDSIDAYYHDPEVLQLYYKNVYEIGAFARQLWRNQQIDVRFPEDTPEEIQASQYYQQLLQTTAYLEDRLIRSQELKEEGFANSEIEKMETEGLAPKYFRLLESQTLIGLERGDEGNSVWQLQLLLRELGYEIPLDGIFSSITEQALKDFQQKEHLYSSGQVDESSLRKLVDR